MQAPDHSAVRAVFERRRPTSTRAVSVSIVVFIPVDEEQHEGQDEDRDKDRDEDRDEDRDKDRDRDRDRDKDRAAEVQSGRTTS